MMKGNPDNIKDELRIVNRALRVLSDCNKIIIRAVDENKLMSNICKTIAEIGEYRLVWVGFKENDASKSVRPVAYAGHEDGYLDLVNITWGDDSKGPVSTVIRTGKSYVSNDLLEDIALKSWCAEAKKRGYASSITLPLKDKEQTFGALSIYSTKLESFKDEEIRLLAELAGDLSYGIMVVRNSELQKQAEEALKKSEARLKLQIERMPIGHIVWSPEFQVMSWNQTAEKIFGFTSEEALGKRSYDLIVPKSAQPYVDTILKRLLEGDSTAHSEHENITKDGRTIVCYWTNTSLKDDDGTVVGVLSMVQDITERKRAEEKTRRLATVVEDSNDAITIQDFEGNISAWNHGAELMYGYSQEEALMMNIGQIIPPDKEAEQQEFTHKLMSGETVTSFETKRMAKDGHILDVWLTVTKLMDDTGKPIGFATTGRDITSRKRTEEKTRRLATVVEDSNDAITIQDFEGNITAWNHGAELMYGYSEDEALKMNIGHLTPPYKEAEQKEFSRRMLMGETITSLETQRVTKDGRTLDVWLTVTKIVDDAKKPIGIASTERDITERKRAEDVLRESEDRYRNLIENAHDLIQQIAPDGRIIFVNREWLKTMGYTEAELPGLNIFNIIHPDSLSHCREVFSKAMSGESLNNVQVTYMAKDGHLIHAEGNVNAQYIDGRVVASLGIFNDITERKRADDEKEKFQAQLIQSDKLGAIGQLAAGVAHELNNPLTGIMIYSEMLLDKINDNRLDMNEIINNWPEKLKIMREGAIRCEKIVRGLLSFSRLTKHEMRPTNINEIIESTLALLEFNVREQKIKLVKDLQSDIPLIQGDGGELQQVFVSIILNALDAMPDGGTLTIENRAVGRDIEMTITDTGIGIPRDILNRIFEPFFTTKATGKGTGLGLSIAFGIIDAHKGKITVKSDVGKGTTFTIILPLAREDGKP